MSQNKNYEQEDISGSPDKSTQSNESYYLKLNTNQIEKNLNTHIIQGLQLQNRFKDASYLIINSTSIELNAYDTVSNQFVIIKVIKIDNSSSIEDHLQKVKNVTDQNPQLFVQIIHYWILQKENYSLVFIEKEQTSQNLENFITAKTLNGQDLNDEDKFKYTYQILKCIQVLQQQQINTSYISISNYFVKQGDIRLCIHPINSKFSEKEVNEDINKNYSYKNILFSYCFNLNEDLSSLFSTSILILLVNNWLAFNDQLIENLGIFDFVNSIINGQIRQYVQIDEQSVAFTIYQSIQNSNSSQNRQDQGNKYNYSLQIYIDMLFRDNIEMVKKVQQEEQQDVEENQEEICPGLVQKNGIQLLNPSSIINKYINSIQNVNQCKNQFNSSNVQQIENLEQIEDFKIQQVTLQQQKKYDVLVPIQNEQEIQTLYLESNQKQQIECNQYGDLQYLKEQEQSLNELQNNIKEKEQILQEDQQNIIKEQGQIQIQLDQSLNVQQLNLKQSQSNIQDQFTIDYSESTPAHSNLLASSEKFQIKQTIIDYNQNNDYLIDNNNFNQHIIQIEETNQKSDVIIFTSNKQQVQENNDNNQIQKDDQRLDNIKVIQQNEKEQVLNDSYNHNNVIDIELKDVDISISSNRQKNEENKNVEQKSNETYQRYLLDLEIECENINEIYITEMFERNNCFLYKLSCVEPITFIRIKLILSKNPYLGKSIMEVIFLPFIKVFNKPWIIKNNNRNIIANIIQHLFLWLVKMLNIILMIVLVTIYLSLLLTVLILIHIVYFLILLLMAVVFIPVGFIRIYMRIYLKLSDCKSAIIFHQQSTYTWFQNDVNFQKAKDFNLFHNKMQYRKYQYLQSPNKQFINNSYQR